MPGTPPINTEECWLKMDDCETRSSRAIRMREALNLFPTPENGLFTFGGMETMGALVEARLAYVNGLFLCTVLSALVALERHFAGILYARGLESAKRMSFEDLLKRATREKLIGPEDQPDFEEFRMLRNAYAHFRAPSHELSSLRRSVKYDLPYEDLVQEDARQALSILGRHFSQRPYPNVRFY